MPFRFFLAAALVLTLAAPAAAEEKDYQQVVKLFDGTRNVVGETLAYPQTGPAHVTAMIVTMKPGEETGPHRHGVPTFGYILEGQVTVDYGAKGSRTYRKGDGFMEAEAVTHNGVNDGTGPVRILVVFMSAEGAPPNVIHEK
jgi:quercetin dioxygenase-like cupin family protein